MFTNVVRQKIVISLKKFLRLCKPGDRWIEPVGIKTDILLHNPLTDAKVALITKRENVLTWYVCGPTVYDSAHLGHACCYMHFDIIRRIMERYFHLKVVQAMCITDVDDKIIKKSIELNTNWSELTKKYEIEFLDDLTSLNIKLPQIIARVTDHIPQIIRFIARLLEMKLAYVAADGSVYFDTVKYGKCGKLCLNQDTNEYRAQSEWVLEHKNNAADFALWKGYKLNEPFWEAPWGRGRPGWHIECSSIASEYFGSCIDIHSGGKDLMFPHHENEESQSCAYHGIEQWVNYWMYTGHVHINQEKMSKSLQNTIRIRDFLQSFSSDHLRMFCLRECYRSGVEYNEENMTEAINVCHKFRSFFEDCESYLNGSTVGNIDSELLLKIVEETKCKLQNHLKDDFDTSSSIRCLLHLVNVTNKMFGASVGNRCYVSVANTYNFVQQTLENFGLSLSNKSTEKNSNVDSDMIKQLLDVSLKFRSAIRNTAMHNIRNNKEEVGGVELYQHLLKLCDEYRNNLLQNGITVKDRGNQCSWSFVKKKIQ